MDGRPVYQKVQRLADFWIGQERMGRPGTGALAIHLGPRIREVALDVLHAPGHPDVYPSLAPLLEPTQDVVLDLHVPGVVVLACLEHCARRRGRIAAALHLQRVEERPVGDVVAGVHLGADQVARPEVDEAVGPGADGLEVGGGFARLRASERLEEVLWDDHAPVAAEGVGPEGLGLVEHHLDGVAVQLLDAADLTVRAAGHGGGRWIRDVLPVEDDVVGGEGLAIVPGDALFQIPRDPRAVLGHRARRHTGRVRSQDGDDVALGVEGAERLVEDARGVLVLGAGAEVRVEQRRRLPPQHLHRPAAAALGGRERGRLRLGGHAGGREQLRGHRRREAKADHRLHEGAATQAAGLHVTEQRADRGLVHHARASSIVVATSRASTIDS